MKSNYSFTRNTAGLLMTITIASLVSPGASAAVPPSGKYLDVTTNVVYTYDNSTGLMLASGINSYPFEECHTQTWPWNSSSSLNVSYDRCGSCVYVPNDNQSVNDGRGWTNNLATYTYGYCASVDLGDAHAALVRMDIAAVNLQGEHWSLNLVTQYFDVNNTQIGGNISVSPHSSCRVNSQVSLCQGQAFSFNPFDLQDAPTSFHHYCVVAQIYYKATEAPKVADPCAPYS